MGTFDVYCAQCHHVTRVHKMTHKKECDSCGSMIINHGAGLLTCRGCGQHDLVGGSTMHHKCSKCNMEMKIRDETDTTSSSDEETDRRTAQGLNVGTTTSTPAGAGATETRTLYTKTEVDRTYQ